MPLASPMRTSLLQSKILIAADVVFVRDRDAKQKWANQLAGGWSIGGLGGSVLAGVVKNSVGRVFR